jgi:hypothetical protein
MLLTYGENATAIKPASGEPEKISEMARITNSEYMTGMDEDMLQDKYRDIVQTDSAIVGIYQNTGLPAAILGAAGTVILLIKVIRDLLRKQRNKDQMIFLVILGMIGTCIITVFGVEWFCNFITDRNRKIYDYLCAVIPLIQIIEAVGIYYLIRYVVIKIKAPARD